MKVSKITTKASQLSELLMTEPDAEVTLYVEEMEQEYDIKVVALNKQKDKWRLYLGDTKHLHIDNQEEDPKLS